MSRRIAVGGLSCLLGLAALWAEVELGASGASVVTTASGPFTTSLTGIAGTVTASGGGTTVTSLARSQGVTPAEQTHPSITPRSGGPHTEFVVQLTARTRLGTHGVLSSVYRVNATGPNGPGCTSVQAATIDRGAPGQRLRVVLRPEPAGWCAGDWHGAVLLEQGPNCVKRRVCPEFVTRLIRVGRFVWRVSVTSTLP